MADCRKNKKNRTFEDRHESTRAYIDFMRPCCVELNCVSGYS